MSQMGENVAGGGMLESVVWGNGAVLGLSIQRMGSQK